VRDRATLARLVGEGEIENLYRLQLMNATETVQRYRIEVQGLEQVRLLAEPVVEVAPAQARWVTVAVRLPAEAAGALGPGAHRIDFLIQPEADASARLQEKSTFVVPR
jgi:polyferredoxin